MNDQFKKKVEKKFERIAKNHFRDPEDCTELAETRSYLAELNKIIQHFERKFDYIPSSAQLLFNEYNSKQEQMLFEAYKKKYLKE